jgi:hypothetical protein
VCYITYQSTGHATQTFLLQVQFAALIQYESPPGIESMEWQKFELSGGAKRRAGGRGRAALMMELFIIYRKGGVPRFSWAMGCAEHATILLVVIAPDLPSSTIIRYSPEHIRLLHIAVQCRTSVRIAFPKLRCHSMRKRSRYEMMRPVAHQVESPGHLGGVTSIIGHMHFSLSLLDSCMQHPPDSWEPG